MTPLSTDAMVRALRPRGQSEIGRCVRFAMGCAVVIGLGYLALAGWHYYVETRAYVDTTAIERGTRPGACNL